FGGRRDNQVLAAHSAHLGPALVGPFPAVDVGKEDGARLKRLLEKETVTVTLKNASALRGPVTTPNVVAELRGRDEPDEWVLVGAHLDSWDYATGAQDNGSGVAQVLEA